MQQGLVKWFDGARGYGFIQRDAGGDVFVHYSGIVGDGYRSLNDGDRVSFDTRQTDKGPLAYNVYVIEVAA